MRELIDQPLLSAGETTWTYGDAVLLGVHLGLWQALEVRAADGVAREEAGLRPDEDDLAEAIVAFRREHRLHAAEDLRKWLEERKLTSADLQGVLARQVLCERELDSPPPRPARERVAEVITAEAFISGTLAECAQALAERAAAYERDPGAAAAPEALARLLPQAKQRGLDVRRAELVLAADAAHAALLEQSASEERMQVRLKERRLDLTRVRLDAIEVEAEHAAREAVMCVKIDGMGLSQVAARAGVECRAIEEEIGDLDEVMRAGVASGRPGELIGPLAAEGTWHVAVVQDRRPPVLSDEGVRARLAEELGRRALERHSAGRLVWHGDA